MVTIRYPSLESISGAFALSPKSRRLTSPKKTIKKENLPFKDNFPENVIYSSSFAEGRALNRLHNLGIDKDAMIYWAAYEENLVSSKNIFQGVQLLLPSSIETGFLPKNDPLNVVYQNLPGGILLYLTERIGMSSQDKGLKRLARKNLLDSFSKLLDGCKIEAFPYNQGLEQMFNENPSIFFENNFFEKRNKIETMMDVFFERLYFNLDKVKEVFCTRLEKPFSEKPLRDRERSFLRAQYYSPRPGILAFNQKTHAGVSFMNQIMGFFEQRDYLHTN